MARTPFITGNSEIARRAAAFDIIENAYGRVGTEDGYLTNVIFAAVTTRGENVVGADFVTRRQINPLDLQRNADVHSTTPEQLEEWIRLAFWFQNMPYPPTGDTAPVETWYYPGTPDGTPVLAEPEIVYEPELPFVPLDLGPQVVDSDLPHLPSPIDPCSLSLPANSLDSTITPINWPNRSKYEPYYDKAKFEYVTTVEAPDNWLPQPVSEEIIFEGVKQLAEFYNKKTISQLNEEGDTEVEQIRARILNNVITEHHLSVRPRDPAKILIRVSKESFEYLPIKTPCIDYAEITSATKNTTTTLRELIRQIGKVSKKLYQFSNSNECIKLTGINLKSEADRLVGFIPKLRKLFKDNCFEFDENSEKPIEIGFNNENGIAYILFDSKPACIGFKSFKDTDPVNSPRTANYVSRLQLMERDLDSRAAATGAETLATQAVPPSMTEFVLEHTEPPCLTVKPSLVDPAKIKKFGDKVENLKNKIENFDVRDHLPSLDSPADLINFASESIEGIENFISQAESAYRTAERIMSEDEYILSADFSHLGALAAEATQHFVGDDIFGNLPNLIRTIGEGDASIDTLYKELLNKINIGVIKDLAAALIMGMIPNFGDTLSCAVEDYYKNIEEIFQKLERNLLPDFEDDGYVSDFINQQRSQLSSSIRAIDDAVNNVCLQVARGIPVNTNGVIEEVALATGKFLVGDVENPSGTPLGLETLYVFSPGLPKKYNREAVRDLAKFTSLAAIGIKSTELLCHLPPIPDITEIEIPSMPDIPDMPTFDFMEWVIPTVKVKIEEIVIDIIINIVISILRPLIDFKIPAVSLCTCADPELSIGEVISTVDKALEFGALDIEDVLGEALGFVGMGGLMELPGQVEEFAKKINNKLGQIVDTFSCFPTGTGLDVLGGNMHLLLEDMTSVLTPSELSSLLGGSPSKDALKAAKNVIKDPKFDEIKSAFSNKLGIESEIKDFMFHIGSNIDKSSLDKKAEEASGKAQGDISSDYLEKFGEEQQDKKKSLLSKKYKDAEGNPLLSPEQINEEILKEQKRNCLDALKIMKGPSTSASTEMAVMMPEMMGEQGMIPRTPPTVAYMMERTIDTMFEGLRMTFEQNLHGPQGYIQSLSFNSRTRGMYDQFKMMAALAPEFESLANADINTNLVGLNSGMREELEKKNFKGDPYGRIDPREGTTRAGEDPDPSMLQIDLKFSSPLNTNKMAWKFQNLFSDNDYRHKLEVPTPNFSPYSSDTDRLKIYTGQTLDVDRYGGDVPAIVGSLENFGNPIDIFSAIALRDLQDELGDFDTNSVRNHLKRKSFYRTTVDIMKMFVDEILKSSMFRTTPNPDNANSFPNWRFEPPSDRRGATQTTLLGLEELREEAKLKYKEYIPKKGEKPTAAMQNATGVAVVQALVRLHVVEIFLRTLPVFEMFNKDSIIGEDFVEYIKRKVQESCVKRDPFSPGYYENILDLSKKFYEQEWELNKRSLKDPLTEDTLASPDEIDLGDALNYIIKLTLKNLSPEKFTNGIYPVVNESLYENLLFNMLRYSLPSGGSIFDAPKRLSDPSPRAGSYYENRFEKDTNLDPLVTIDLRHGLETFEDGGLLLEKFIEYEQDDKIYRISIDETGRSFMSGVSKIKFGLRLIYLPELSKALDVIDDGLRTEYHEEFEYGALENIEASERLRTFHIKEKLDAPREDSTIPYYRTLAPLPLVTVTSEEYDKDDAPSWSESEATLIERMIEHPRFKILFEHCFPLKKILSIMTIYTEVAFSSKMDKEIYDVFDQSKDLLRSCFDSSENINNFALIDTSIQSAGGPSGLLTGKIKKTFSQGREKVSFDNSSGKFVFEYYDRGEGEDE